MIEVDMKDIIDIYGHIYIIIYIHIQYLYNYIM